MYDVCERILTGESYVAAELPKLLENIKKEEACRSDLNKWLQRFDIDVLDNKKKPATKRKSESSEPSPAVKKQHCEEALAKPVAASALVGDEKDTKPTLKASTLTPTLPPKASTPTPKASPPAKSASKSVAKTAAKSIAKTDAKVVAKTGTAAKAKSTPKAAAKNPGSRKFSRVVE